MSEAVQAALPNAADIPQAVKPATNDTRIVDHDERMAIAHVENERSLLGSLLLNGDRIGEVADLVNGGDFSKPIHATIWRVMQNLHERGEPIDADLVKTEIVRLNGTPPAETAFVLAQMMTGAMKSANLIDYAERVAKAARQRDRLVQLDAARRAIVDDSPMADDLIDGLAITSDERPALEPADMSTLADPACGEMKYLLPGSTPAVTLITVGAEWKVGKTFQEYRKAIDAAMGNRVLGFYPATNAIRVGILQLEMPSTEDRRRMRRLSLGCGIEERHLPDLFNDGQIVMFNRPKVKVGGREEPFNLTNQASRDMLHEASEKHGIKFWIVDSVIRAFAGANLNDNSEVAGLLCQAFDPLTSAGCSVEQCHHKRKTGPDGKDDPKSSLLAAQAFGAGSGLILGLSSLPDRDDFLPAHGLHKFVNRLSVLGAWGPTDCSELAIGFYDEGPRTMCHTTADMAQVAKSNKTRRCAWLASEIVRDKPGLNMTDLAARIVVKFPDEFHGDKTSGRTAQDGIKEAEAQEWIENRGKGRGQASDYHPLGGGLMASP